MSDFDRGQDAVLRATAFVLGPQGIFKPRSMGGTVVRHHLAKRPVYVVQDLPEALTFLIEVDDAASLSLLPDAPEDQVAEGRRQYVTTLTRRRVHQTAFRERVPRVFMASGSNSPGNAMSVPRSMASRSDTSVSLLLYQVLDDARVVKVLRMWSHYE